MRSNKVDSNLDKARKTKLLKRAGYHLAGKLAVISLMFSAAVFLIFGVTRVRGNDMAPALKDGDIVIYFRLDPSYSPGDVLIINHDDKETVSRVTADRGDVIKKTCSSELIINDRIHPLNKEEGVFYETYTHERMKYPVCLRKDEYFVLGDKRDTALDSRSWGAVRKKDIKGRIFAVIRISMI